MVLWKQGRVTQLYAEFEMLQSSSITMTPKKRVCNYNIRLKNQESHNLGWQLTHMSLNIEFSLSLPMEKNFLKRKRFLYLSVCTEELHDLAFLLLPKCLISQYMPLFIFCIRFVWWSSFRHFLHWKRDCY